MLRDASNNRRKGDANQGIDPVMRFCATSNFSSFGKLATSGGMAPKIRFPRNTSVFRDVNWPRSGGMKADKSEDPNNMDITVV